MGSEMCIRDRCDICIFNVRNKDVVVVVVVCLINSYILYQESQGAKSESLKKILVKILFSYIVNKIDKSS